MPRQPRSNVPAGPRFTRRALLLGALAATALPRGGPRARSATRRMVLVTWSRPVPPEALEEDEGFLKLAAEGARLAALRPPEGGATTALEALLTGSSPGSRTAAPTVLESARKELGLGASDAWLVATGPDRARLAVSGAPGHGADTAPRRLELGAWQRLRAGSGAPGEPSSEGAVALRRMLANQRGGAAAGGLPARARAALEDVLLGRAAGGAAEGPEELAFRVAGLLLAEAPPRLLVVELGAKPEGDGEAAALEALARLRDAVTGRPDLAEGTFLAAVPGVRPGGDVPRHGVLRRPVHTTEGLWLGPGIPAGTEVKRVVNTEDVVPTIGRLMDFKTPGATGRVIREVAG